MPTRDKQSRRQRNADKVRRSAAVPDGASAQMATSKVELAEGMRRLAKIAPGRLRIDLNERELTIRRSLKNPQGFNTLLINVAGLAILLFLGLRLWPNRSVLLESNSAWGIIAAVVAILPILYYSLLVLFDEEIIRINAEGVRVFYRPLPYRGKWIRTQEIEQLYTVSYERAQLSSLQSRHKKYETVYGVRVKTSQGKEMPLVGGIATPEEASYVERVIEKSLGIQDVPDASLVDFSAH
ncbi:MAG: hypothetical protein U0175_11445 [Caldilineaceae bacterium]